MKTIEIINARARKPEWSMAEPVNFTLEEGEHIAIINFFVSRIIPFSYKVNNAISTNKGGITSVFHVLISISRVT